MPRTEISEKSLEFLREMAEDNGEPLIFFLDQAVEKLYNKWISKKLYEDYNSIVQQTNGGDDARL